MTIDPTHMTVTDWCDSMAFILAPFLVPQKLLSENEWKLWARNVIQSPALARVRPPDPEYFSSWREWAYRFNQTIENLL